MAHLNINIDRLNKKIEITGNPDAKKIFINFKIVDFDILKPRPKEVDISNLSFGYKLTREDGLHFSQFFPPLGVRPLATKHDLINSFDVDLMVETEYRLKVWVEFEGITLIEKKIFNTGLPNKTYQSMIWNTETQDWDFAKKYPQDGKIYRWNEEKIDWEIFKFEKEDNES